MILAPRRHRLGSLLTAALFGAAATTACLHPASGRPLMALPTQGPALPVLPALVELEPPASLTAGDAFSGSVGVRVADTGNDALGLPPARALEAYQRAATVLARADPACGLSWPLLAAIGAVESDHGRTGGSRLDDAGVAHPAILGVPLYGTSSTSRITDTDRGTLDGDPRIDRAVGPMQLIPSTWEAVAVDGDADGVRDPQDIDDASLAAGVYLCAWHDDLTTEVGLRAAVFRYNRSTSYVDRVVRLMLGYAEASATVISAALVSTISSPAVDAAGSPVPGPSDAATPSPDAFWVSAPLNTWDPAPSVAPTPTPSPPTPSPPAPTPLPTAAPTPTAVPTSPPTSEPTTQPTSTSTPSSSPTPTTTPNPTDTPTPTTTPNPTDTPTPTTTPNPTDTPPAPAASRREGRHGDRPRRSDLRRRRR